MKRFAVFFLVLFSIIGCKDSVVKAPKKLIEENQMIDIIYDLALLDAMKMQGNTVQQEFPSPTKLLQEKYKIDSISFAENTKYYASDVANYRKMYEKVKERLNEESTNLNGGVPVQPNPEGVVK